MLELFLGMIFFCIALFLAVLSYWNYRRSERFLDEAKVNWDKALKTSEETIKRYKSACADMKQAERYNENAQKRLKDLDAFWKYDRVN